MTSWRLWRALNTTPRGNPIFAEMLRQSGQRAPLLIVLIEMVAFLLVAPMLLFTSLIYSVGWTVGISSAIAGERARGSYDLLAVTPAGALAASWAIGIAFLHRSGNYQQINGRNAWAGRLMVIGLLYFAFVVSPRAAENVTIAPQLLTLGALAAALLIDHLHCICLSVLVGLLVPTYSADTGSAQLFAFAGFLALRLAVYVLCAAVAFGVLPPLIVSLRLHEIVAHVAYLALCLGIFFALAEVMIWWLWRLVRERLNAEAELDALTRGAV
jgi:hypothetical protein